MKQGVRYVHAADGANLAWAVLGRGMPLVKVATWLTHLQHDIESPVWQHWIQFFAEHFRFVRYDERGCGLSDRQVGTLSFSNWVDDLERVIDAAAIERPFALLGISQGAAVAIAYALRHPRRVSHLILYGGYALGGHKREDARESALYRAVEEVVRLGWGSDNPAFRQLFTSRFIPAGTIEQLGWFNTLCNQTASAEIAHRLMVARGDVDVRGLLSRVRTPTLVLHASRDQIAPPAQARILASGIPGATFVELDSDNHVLLAHEPAWKRFCEAVLEFTGQAHRGALVDGLTRREREILELLCEGRSNAQIAWALDISEKTVRNHI
jgi:pimeloyl-ACP methyl ester carboxylesterase